MRAGWHFYVLHSKAANTPSRQVLLVKAAHVFVLEEPSSFQGLLFIVVVVVVFLRLFTICFVFLLQCAAVNLLTGVFSQVSLDSSSFLSASFAKCKC